MLNREQRLSGHVCRWQVAKTKQRIEEEKMQILVVERTQQIMLQEQEITRREKELEAKVKKPAEAERYRLEKLAGAQRWVSRLWRKNLIHHPSIVSVSLLFCPCVMKKSLNTFY